MIRQLFVLFFLTILISSCGSTRIEGVKVKRKSARFLLNEMEKTLPDYTTFSGRARIKYADRKNKTSFTANIRLEKDKRIWISISPMMNIEVGRALITPDSIKIIDRINKEYTARSFDFIENYVDYPVDFTTLQELIIGTLVPEVANDRSDIRDNAHLLRKENRTMENFLWIDPFRYYIKKMEIYDVKRRQKMTVQLNDYTAKADGFFSEERYIVLKAPESAEINIDYSRVSFNKDLEFPFTVSSQYR